MLTIKNADKTAIAEFAKMSSAIYFESKHSWIISNTDMDATGDLKLIDIKKY